jgi:hypothetical protein
LLTRRFPARSAAGERSLIFFGSMGTPGTDQAYVLFTDNGEQKFMEMRAKRLAEASVQKSRNSTRNC